MGNAWKLLFLLFGVVSCYKSYKDFKVYDITSTPDQLEDFSRWQYEEGVDFWQRPIAGRLMNIVVSPENQKNFEGYLSRANISHQVSIEDLEVILEEERQNMERSRQLKPFVVPGEGGRVVPDFTRFWTSNEMETYSTFLAATYPQFIQMETLTFSPGGRRIYALKLSSGVFGQKPIIGMESGMHAREWVCPPTVFYLIHRLIEDPATRNELLSRVDFLIVPMQNPDGYTFSQTNDRMWRLNRRQQTPTCIGVDLNRNNLYSWRPPTIFQPCGSQTYPGVSAMSEPETFALHQIMERYASNMKLYLSVHSFGDMVLWPWGYSGSPGWISTWPEHDALGNKWRDDILAQGGRPYIVGNVADVLGNAFGAIDDHMAGHFRIPYVYTLELTSGFQFIYPEERIEALSHETFWGYRAMILHIAQKFNP